MRRVTAGGHRDWRLPTRFELAGIVDYAMDIPPVDGPALDPNVFRDIVVDYCRRLLPDEDAVRDDRSFDALLADVEAFDPEPAECRDADLRYQTARWPAPPDALSGTDFVIDDAAGTVVDSATGLMWQRLTGGRPP